MTAEGAPTTEEVLARRVLDRELRDEERFVAWAIARLEAGDDTPALRELAGESAPFHALAFGELCDRALEELGFAVPPTRREAEELWAASVMRRMLAGELTPRDALKQFVNVAQRFEDIDDPELGFVYLAHCAYDDYDTGDLYRDDHGVLRSHYLHEATAETIDDVVRGKCEAWLREHGGPA